MERRSSVCDRTIVDGPEAARSRRCSERTVPRERSRTRRRLPSKSGGYNMRKNLPMNNFTYVLVRFTLVKVTLALAFLSISALAAAQEMPDESELRAAVSTAIPRYTEIIKLIIEATDNIG